MWKIRYSKCVYFILLIHVELQLIKLHAYDMHAAFLAFCLLPLKRSVIFQNVSHKIVAASDKSDTALFAATTDKSLSTYTPMNFCVKSLWKTKRNLTSDRLDNKKVIFF